MEGGSIREGSFGLASALMLLGLIICIIIPVFAEDNPSKKCLCAYEPEVCPQYSVGTSCQNNLPLLISPLNGSDLLKRTSKDLDFSSNWRISNCEGSPKKHTGVDLRTNVPEVVRAISDGTVMYVGLSSNKCPIWAKAIIIDHGGLFTSVYEHVNPVVAIGTSVKKGDTIANVASIQNTVTDCNTINHLHFGIRCGGLSGCEDSGQKNFEESLRSGICLRGALPSMQSDCEYTSTCSRTYCRCDPMFPGGFIDPLDLFYANYLNQLKLDGSRISTGDTIKASTVLFRAKLQGPQVKFQGPLVDKDSLFEGERIKLQVELRRLDEYNGKFIDSEGHEKDFKESEYVASGSEATAYAYGLIEGNYHWRARAVSEDDGTKSGWVEFGGNDISEADFTVSAKDVSSSSIVGEWTLYSRRSSNFIPSDSIITFHDDYTLSDSLYGTGRWKRNGDTVHWEYDMCGEEVCTRYKTTYDGTIGFGMKGTMLFCDGEEGDWSAEPRTWA